MHKLEVYHGPILVGTGYQFISKYGQHEPTLINNSGGQLEQGWYMLHYVGEPTLAVMALDEQ